jgi:hypothetical protein
VVPTTRRASFNVTSAHWAIHDSLRVGTTVPSARRPSAT